MPLCEIYAFLWYLIYPKKTKGIYSKSHIHLPNASAIHVAWIALTFFA